MIDLTQVEAILIAIIPALTAVGSIIAVAVKIFTSFADLKKSVADNTENKELREQLLATQTEMRKLQKLYALAIEKQVKIKYSDMTEVRNDEEIQNP